MKGLSFLLILILIILTNIPFDVSESQAGKPRGPLDLVISTDASPASGAVIGVTLTVTSRMDAPELTVTVELPEGLPHRNGPLHWTGVAAPDQPVSLTIQVGPLTTQPYEIIGRATVTLPNGSVWTQATSILLEPGTHLPPQADEAEKPMPRLGHDRQGRSILEIPVQ